MQYVYNSLLAQGVQIYLDGERLKARSLLKEMTRESIEIINENKQQLIQFLLNKQSLNNFEQISPIERNASKSYQSSFSQQRLWFIDNLQSGSPEYNLSMVFDVYGKLNFGAMTRALKSILSRHEILRTVYELQDGEVIQVIKDFSDINFCPNFYDLSTLDTNALALETQRIVFKECKRVFNLSKDVMLRFSYLKLSHEHGKIIFNTHHICSDGWSIKILTRELCELYNAYCNKKSSPLPPQHIQYVDYTYWLHKRLSGRTLELQIKYWTEHLAQAPAVHSVQLDFPRTEVKQNIGALVSGQISSNTTEKLLNIAKQHRLTPFMLLHAVLSLVLSRHGNNSTIVMGTPTANRQCEQLDSLIGFFVNTLVLKVNTDHNSIREYLHHVKQSHLDAQSNQDVPFDKLVELLKIPRSAAHTPIFQIMVTKSSDFFHSDSVDSQSISLIDLELVPISSGFVPAKFDLVVNFHIDERRIGIEWVYDCSLFREERIEQLNKHLCFLLEDISNADSDSSLAQLNMLSQCEVKHLLYTLNNTEQFYGNYSFAHEIFEKFAEEKPDNVALAFSDKQITYQQLNERANQFARYLLDKHYIKSDTLIGVCAERSIEMVIAVVAIFKAGGVYVPLDPKYPRDRMNYMLKDSGINLMLGTDDELSKWSDYGGKIDRIDDVGDFSSPNQSAVWFHHKKCNLKADDVGLTGDSLAYVIYTSGSTGKPKGVMIKHSAFINCLSDNTKRLSIEPSSVLYHTMSLAFDAAIWVLWNALIAGSKLRLATSLDFQRELEYYSDVTHLFMTPSILECLVPNTYQSIKVVFAGGEYCPPKLVRKWSEQGVDFFNGYGPTEITVCSSIGHVTHSDDIHIGRPNGNVQYFVFDGQQRLLPFGVIGELYIGGKGLAKGYLNRPELTEERFISNPYYEPDNPMSCRTLYRTGDMVSYLPDGTMMFRGRIDNQVKIRGIRIELGEIEACYSGMPWIESAFVVVKKVNGKEILVVYVKLLEPNQDDVLEQIKLNAKKQLPEYMIPSAILFIDAWPTTANGKINVNALPSPAIVHSEYVEPNTEHEKILAKIWSELLKVPTETISANANFFELGGHSLLSVRLSTALRAKLAVEITVKVIFENPILRTLALWLDQCLEANEALALKAVVKEGDSVPLSFAQQRLWFINKLQGETPEYNISLVFDLEGSFDLNIATVAFRSIVQRHKVLNSTYYEHEGEVAQYVRPFTENDFSIRVYDLHDRQDQEMDNETDKFITTECSKPFDLSNDLMLRVSYVKASSTTGTLIVVMHHIASDGWSIQILKNEFITLYNNFIKLGNNPFTPLDIQYADYALWQRAQQDEGRLLSQFEYWENKLTNMPTLHCLPLDFERPKYKGRKGALIIDELSSIVTEKLMSIALENKLTPFMLLHGALSLLLARHSNERHIVIGTPVANRGELQVEQLIGFFVNTLVLKVDTKHSTLAEYFAHLREVNIDAQSNQDVAVEWLVERLNIPRSTSYTPLFQIVMAINSEFGADVQNSSGAQDLHDVKITARDTNNIHSKFDLEVDFTISGKGLLIEWTYDVELFSESHIKQLSSHLRYLFEQISESSVDDTLNSLTLFSKEEVNVLISNTSSNCVPNQSDKSIYELFEEVVAFNPGCIALVYNDASLTYGQLNENVSKLEKYLVSEHHVQPGFFIGLCAQPSFELIIGMLAILKAGAAYIPIDPDYPVDRANFILQDSGTTMMLCQAGCEKNISEFSGSVISIGDVITSYQETKDRCKFVKNAAISSNDLAYVIYTSGSTGIPKGVLIENKSVINLVVSQIKNYRIKSNSGEVGLLLSSYAFDASVEQIFVMLLSSNTLVIPTKQTIVEPKLLGDLINRYQVTHLDSTPSHLMSLCELLNYPSVKRIISGGERMLPSLLTYARTDVFNVYGPTEVCVTSSVALNSEMLGVPLNNTQYYVLDKELQFTPFNGVGELYIGGDGLARGYLNRPELTEKHFIVNPFYDPELAGSSTRLYKTGDLVRYLPDGNLSFVGRVDDQVKIRGFRIELGELENQIASIDVVDAAVVMTFEISGSMQLVAYVKPVENTSKLEDVKFIEEIKEKLKQRVPSYMMPTIFLAIKEWPLTVNGKINRRILPAPDISAHQGNYVRPRTELEYKLRSIWSDTLALSPDAIGINSSFFDLGGHSLLSVKLLSAIQSQLCSSVELTMLFSSDTISEQAKCIECLQNERQSSLLYKITEFDSHSSAVIFVPGAASTAKDFAEIFSALNRDDVEIAVLKHKGLLLGEEYFATVEEAATTYGELLLSTKLIQFKLVGHSFGGALAIEIARYLLSHNCTVEVLLLETYFLAVAFVRDEERDVLPKNQVTITDIPAHMLALYEHQSRLSDSYSPIGSLDCNVSLVFATESPIELSIYKQYLDEELKFQYKHLSLIKGNHMGILKGHGAEEIANLVSLFNEHKV